MCLPRLCSSRPCNNGGTCLELVDSKGNSKFRCQCPRGFEGALCEVESSVVVADIPGVVLEDGLIIGGCGRCFLCYLSLSGCLPLNRSVESPDEELVGYNCITDNHLKYSCFSCFRYFASILPKETFSQL